MQTIGDLAGQLHGLGTSHSADLQRKLFLNRTSCRGDTGLAVELAPEVDRPPVEEGAHHAVRFTQARDWARSTPLDDVLLEHRDVADPKDDLGAAVGPSRPKESARWLRSRPFL
jgi:hypothetical protein